jgi:hypothetical protein
VFIVVGGVVGWTAGLVILLVTGRVVFTESGDALAWVVGAAVLALAGGPLAVMAFANLVAVLPAGRARGWLDETGVSLAALLLPGTIALVGMLVLPALVIPAAALALGFWVLVFVAPEIARRLRRRRRRRARHRDERPPG